MSDTKLGTTGYATVIFDLDGTLLNTIEDLHLALAHALDACGLAPATLAQTQARVGNGRAKLIERSLPASASPELTTRVTSAFDHYYAAHKNDHTRPYPGMVELAARLRDEGMRVAVVSNKSNYAVRELMDSYYPGVFDVAMGSSDTVPKKPNRIMVDTALTRLGAAAQADAAAGRAVYVGDSEVDVATAANAGLPCIAVSWGFRTVEQLRAAGAATIASTADELAHAIRG